MKICQLGSVGTTNEQNSQSMLSSHVYKVLAKQKLNKNALESAENLRVDRMTRNRYIIYFGLIYCPRP